MEEYAFTYPLEDSKLNLKLVGAYSDTTVGTYVKNPVFT